VGFLLFVSFAAVLDLLTHSISPYNGAGKAYLIPLSLNSPILDIFMPIYLLGKS